MANFGNGQYSVYTDKNHYYLSTDKFMEVSIQNSANRLLHYQIWLQYYDGSGWIDEGYLSGDLESGQWEYREINIEYHRTGTYHLYGEMTIEGDYTRGHYTPNIYFH